MGDNDGIRWTPVCRHCRDVVGFYEPLILETPTERRETSLAAEPGLADAAATMYHQACYELARGDVR